MDTDEIDAMDVDWHATAATLQIRVTGLTVALRRLTKAVEDGSVYGYRARYNAVTEARAALDDVDF